MTWNPATSDGILNPWGCFVHDSVVKTCSVCIISDTPMVVAASPKASYTKTGQGVATLMHWRRQCPEISNCPGLGKKSAQYSLSCKPCQCHGNARMHNANALSFWDGNHSPQILSNYWWRLQVLSHKRYHSNGLV